METKKLTKSNFSNISGSRTLLGSKYLKRLQYEHRTRSAGLLFSSCVTPFVRFLCIHAGMTFPTNSGRSYDSLEESHPLYRCFLQASGKSLEPFDDRHTPGQNKFQPSRIWVENEKNIEDYAHKSDFKVLCKVDGKQLVCKWCRLSISGDSYLP